MRVVTILLIFGPQDQVVSVVTTQENEDGKRKEERDGSRDGQTGREGTEREGEKEGERYNENRKTEK